MSEDLNYTVHSKEKIYFALKVIFAMLGYAIIFWALFNSLSSVNPVLAPIKFVFYFYGSMIILFLIFRLGIMIGYLKGNAVKVRDNQFPDVYDIVNKQSEKLGLKRVPDTYILQSGGMLNAFATRFLGTNYIVLYSDVLETAYQKNAEAVEFIIGHELGHIKRNHLVKRLWLFPSAIIPFLGAAYSRACEYTCDSIGHSLSPAGVKTGLLILAAGKKLHSKINVTEYMQQDLREDGFWMWFAEKTASHPHLTKRLRVFKNEIKIRNEAEPNLVMDAAVEINHSKYMPVG